jgi:glycosyltransferase involved in cell wall biosynthesis
VRILHVIPALAPRFGGPPKVIVEMCRELARRGEQVALYTTNFDGPGKLKVPLFEPQRDESGLEIRYFPVYPHSYYVMSLSLAAALKRELPGYDLVHIHPLYRFTTAAAAHYCSMFGIPYVMRPHGSLDPFLFRRHRLRKRIYERVFDRVYLGRAAAVQFTSREEMELARGTGFAFNGVVVPLAVTVPDMTDAGRRAEEFRARWPATRGHRVILYLGRLTFKKGLDLLVRAFGEVCRRRSDVHLFIAGPDDEGYGAQVRRWLQDEGVLDRATFSGILLGAEKSAAFATADVFVLPSYSENFGVAVLEALASGVPTIISNRVNIWREIADADAGLVVNCDAAELQRALLAMLDDRQLRLTMGAAGRRLASESFGWRTATDQLIALYREIIAERTNNPGRIGQKPGDLPRWGALLDDRGPVL